MNGISTFFRRFWPSMIVVALIVYATVNDEPEGADLLPPIPYLDKLIHAIMFGGLFGALCFDIRRAGWALTRRTLLWLFVGCSLAGACDEVAQTYLTSVRQGDPTDWLADTAGIAVAYFTAPPAVRKVLRKEKSRQ